MVVRAKVRRRSPVEKGFGIGELKEGIDSKCNDRRGTACKAGLMGGGAAGVDSMLF